MSITTPGALVTSYSRLGSYQRCPRKFRYSYIDEALEESTPVPLVFGTAIHEACEAFFDSLAAASPIDEGEVIDVFRRAFNDSVALADEGAPMDWGKQTYAELIDMGERMLRVFLSEVDRSIQIVATEFEFNIEIAPGNWMRGFVDLVIQDDDGFKVIDLKTAAKAYSSHQIAHDMQPTVYLAAAEQVFEAPGRVTFEFWVLTKTKQPRFQIVEVTRNDRDRQELIEAIEDTERAVAAGVYPRLRGWMCGGCQFARQCGGKDAIEYPGESPIRELDSPAVQLPEFLQPLTS